MFTNKKILAALLCTPLFGACVVNGDDDNAETGTGETTATSTATTATTATTTAETGDTSVSTTDSTTADTGSSTEPGDTSAGTTDTDTGGDGMACFLSCAAPEDCCAIYPEGPARDMCVEGVGTYPYSFTCEADSTCGFTGCVDADECTLGGALMNQVCVDEDGVGACYTACEADQDCEDAFLAGFTCTGDDGAGGAYCVAPPFMCETDEDCGGAPGVTCGEDGSCVFFCTSDDDCGGLGTCDTDAGTCGCTTVDDCAEGYTCAGA